SGLAVDQAFFSPNGDGVKDTVTATASNNFDDTNWTVNVRDPSSTIVRTYTVTAAALSYTWDGKNNSGVVQPDGLYTFETLVANGSASASGSVTTTLDNTPPPPT